ncbi:ATP-binding protein [Catenuloplanes sp. NPDC051500]|uniref:ATP-binding protein n=1 Tax=Catenuloplanes sp. NPDC051500 TaxID=3363959 RepID=UPI0037A70E75
MSIVRLRRVTLVALTAAGVAAVTLILGLITNAASEQQSWPGWLSVVQRYPWQALALFAVAAIVLAALLSAVSVEAPPANASAGEPVAAATILRSLPRDTARFTDRREEVARIVAEATAGRAVAMVRTVDGMAGVGKTAFAIHVGHRLASRFPDGQLFVSLGAHTAGRAPAGPADALATLLLADGIAPQRIPNGDDLGLVTEARAAMWRSQVANRRILLILDDASGFAQVEPLLPGSPGSLVLVTSRRRLAAPDAQEVPIRALPKAHAVTLLTQLAGRADIDGDAAAELVALCGSLPLAVSLLAARLRQHPAWTADDLRQRLLNATHVSTELRAGGQNLSAAFDLSYQDLSPEQQQFFRRLSWFPGLDIDEPTAAAVGDIPTTRAGTLLDELFQEHLLDESARGRYRFHDLVRDYGRSLGEDAGQDGTMSIERLAHHYLHLIDAANTYIDRGSVIEAPEFGSRAVATAWLDAERGNIVACVDECIRQNRHALVVKFAAALAPYLRHAGPWDQAVHLHRAATTAARHDGDREAEALALVNAGMASRLMARYRDAQDAFADSLHRFGDAPSRGRAFVLNQLGIVHYLTAAYESSAQAQTESLSLCRALDDSLGQANALADLGMVRRMTGDLTASATASEEALDIYRQIGDRYGEANALRDLGRVRALTGDYPAAQQHARQALTLYTDLGDQVHRAYALDELGVAHRLHGDLDAAATAHTEALNLYTEHGDRFGQANTHHHLGILHRLHQNLPAAAAAQAEAAALYRELDSRGGLAAATAEQALLHWQKGDHRAAIAALEQAASWYAQLGDQAGTAEVQNHLGVIAAATDPQTAYGHHEAALAAARRIGLPLEEARALEGLADYHRSTGMNEEASDLAAQARAIRQRIIGPRPGA